MIRFWIVRLADIQADVQASRLAYRRTDRHKGSHARIEAGRCTWRPEYIQERTQIDLQAGRQTEVQAGGPAHRQVAKCTASKETYRLVGGGSTLVEAGRQTDRKAGDRHVVRQVGIHAGMQT